MDGANPKPEEIIAKLRDSEQSLRAQGVMHAALFGSRARGSARPDIDILIELPPPPDRPIGLFEYVAIAQFIVDMFPVRVDVSNREALKPHVRPAAERHTVYAF